MPRPLQIALALAFLTIPGIAATTGDAKQFVHSVTIYRDTYGVPHIYGPTDASCVFGFAYAQAEDNFWQVEDSYIRALGRASEVYGEKTLNDDKTVRALEIPRLSKAEYERTSPRARELADAFAAGLNYFLERHPAQARLLAHFEPWYIYAFGRYALYQQFILRQAGIQPQELDSVNQPQGSNMWAIAPAKSTTGHAMLFINPHQPFFGVGQWYEGHVHSDEGWDMSGASFFGSAFPTIGHNEYLGWSHTVNRPDIFDVYEETFDNSSDPLSYKYDGGYKKATEWTDTIKVNADARTFHFRKTHHGPILAKRGGKYLAVRLGKFEEGGQMEEWYAMSKAHSLAEFKQAMSAVAIPMFNTMYADREGNIFYVYNGSVPKRDPQFDWLKPVDGSTSATEWHGYHPLSDLPQVTNPPAHFVQNCNSTPFLTTTEGNPDPANFPRYMVGEGDTPRARVSRRILYSQPKFSYEEWSKAGFDTTVLEAEEHLPKLREQWLALKATDDGRYSKLAPVMKEFDNWDRQSRVDSVAMTVFMLWFEKQFGTAVFPKEKGDKDSLTLLEEAVGDLEKTYHTWRVPWGDLNRLERAQSGGDEAFSDAKPSLPVAGAPGDVGIVFNFYARPEKGQQKRYGVAGDSFVSVIDFGPKTEARSILVFGENSDSQSKHYFDQSRIYARGEFKPAWFSLEDIKRNAERTYHPGE